MRCRICRTVTTTQAKLIVAVQRHELDSDSLYNNLEKIFALMAASSAGRKSGSERMRCLRALEAGSMFRARLFSSIMLT